MEFKADVLIKNNKKHNPVMHAVKENTGNISCIQMMLGSFPDTQLCEPDEVCIWHGYGDAQTGTTPLHIAADKNEADAFKLLLKYGAKYINSPTTWGRTPLHNAVSSQFLYGVMILIAAGADIHAVDNVRVIV